MTIEKLLKEIGDIMEDIDEIQERISKKTISEVRKIYKKGNSWIVVKREKIEGGVRYEIISLDSINDILKNPEDFDEVKKLVEEVERKQNRLNEIVDKIGINGFNRLFYQNYYLI